MDPEYMSNAKLTCASDIYSFGIVILQLLSGQKVIELDLDARDQLTRKVQTHNTTSTLISTLNIKSYIYIGKKTVTIYVWSILTEAVEYICMVLQAKDVSLGKRPLSDFEDPHLRGDVNKVDFETILQIAVLCVAKSSKGRPTIDVVFDEMEKAWKNTIADKVLSLLLLSLLQLYFCIKLINL